MSNTATHVTLRQGLEALKAKVKEHSYGSFMPGDVRSDLVDLCINTGLTPVQLPVILQVRLDEARVRDEFGRQTNEYKPYYSGELLTVLDSALKTVA